MNINDYEIFKFSENIYTPFENNGVVYQLNKHPYLDIVLTDHCNQRCKFCCADLIHDKLMVDFEIFKQKIKFAIEHMNVSEVLLLGGEPTLSPILFDVLAYLKRQGLDKIVMTTNGMRLKDKAFRYRLFESGLTHLNISIMSTSLDKQKEISGSDNTMTQHELIDIYRLANDNRVNVRINNNIFLANNDFYEDIVHFYEVYSRYCDSIKFSPLLAVDDFSVINQTSEWVRKHILSEEEVELVFNQVHSYFVSKHGVSFIENNNQFGFVKNTMIPLTVPIILNWNVGRFTGMMNKVVEHKQINNIKLLPNNELSLSWNRELDKYFIKTS